jgi:hypothetical protein
VKVRKLMNIKSDKTRVVEMRKYESSVVKKIRKNKKVGQ